jgi:hypothetical protein
MEMASGPFWFQKRTGKFRGWKSVLHYLTRVYRIRVSLTGGSAERTANFMKTLHQAAEIVRNIVSV